MNKLIENGQYIFDDYVCENEKYIRPYKLKTIQKYQKKICDNDKETIKNIKNIIKCEMINMKDHIETKEWNNKLNNMCKEYKDILNNGIGLIDNKF